MKRRINNNMKQMLLGIVTLGLSFSAMGMESDKVLQTLKDTKKGFETARDTLKKTSTSVTRGINDLSSKLVAGVDQAGAQVERIQKQVKEALTLLGSIPSTLGLSAIAMKAVHLDDLPGVLEYLVNTPMQTIINYMTALGKDYKSLVERYRFGGTVRVPVPGVPGQATLDMTEAFALADNTLGVAINTLNEFIQSMEVAMEELGED